MQEILHAQLLHLRHVDIYSLMVPFVELDYPTNDVFASISMRKRNFFKNTGETVESFLDLMQDVRHLYCQRYNVRHISNLRNKLLIVLIWLRRYLREENPAMWFGLH